MELLLFFGGIFIVESSFLSPLFCDFNYSCFWIIIHTTCRSTFFCVECRYLKTLFTCVSVVDMITLFFKSIPVFTRDLYSEPSFN